MDTMQLVVNVLLGAVFPFVANVLKCKARWRGARAYWAIFVLTIVFTAVVGILTGTIHVTISEDPVEFVKGLGGCFHHQPIPVQDS